MITLSIFAIIFGLLFSTRRFIKFFINSIFYHTKNSFLWKGSLSLACFSAHACSLLSGY